MPLERVCFVIAPIGLPGSDTRKRSDQVLKHIIRPAAADRGYKAIRADEISEPGIITSQVIQQVVDAPLVIADLTERNPNVFYELAVRHALRKPLVQIIAIGEQIPFDVAGMRTIAVDHHDLDSVEETRAEINKQIAAVESADGHFETPISVAVDLQNLRQSENPERRSLGEVLAAIAELRTTLAAVEQKVADPDRLVGNVVLQHAVRVALEQALREIPLRSARPWEDNALLEHRYVELERQLSRIAALLADRSESGALLDLYRGSRRDKDVP